MNWRLHSVERYCIASHRADKAWPLLLERSCPEVGLLDWLTGTGFVVHVGMQTILHEWEGWHYVPYPVSLVYRNAVP